MDRIYQLVPGNCPTLDAAASRMSKNTVIATREYST
jgi:hypothetical protein